MPDLVRQDAKPLSIANMGRLAKADPHEILQRYLSDETTLAISADYGVTRQALTHFLLKSVEEQWKEAQVARAIARKEKAEDGIACAKDAFDLARAREELKSAQWDLERVCRRIYGDSVQGPVSAEGLADLLMAVSERMLKEKQIASIPHAPQQSSGQDDTNT